MSVPPAYDHPFAKLPLRCTTYKSRCWSTAWIERWIGTSLSQRQQHLALAKHIALVVPQATSECGTVSLKGSIRGTVKMQTVTWVVSGHITLDYIFFELVSRCRLYLQILPRISSFFGHYAINEDHNRMRSGLTVIIPWLFPNCWHIELWFPITILRITPTHFWNKIPKI